MKTELIKITPKLAAEWLSKTPEFQRKVRSETVDSYARDMLYGRWAVTHQAIAFDVSGRLIDGQHRLHAIVKAGVSITMLVTTGAPSDSYGHVDLGLKRSVIDALRSQGDPVIKEEYIAVARLIEFADDGKEAVKPRSPFELQALVAKHERAIDFVFQNLERRVRGVTIAPVLAAVGRAFYCERDGVTLSAFLRLLVSGVAQDQKRDGSVIRLRDWLKDNVGAGSYAARKEAFLKTQRVIKAYVSGESLSKLYVPTESVYPLKKPASSSDA